MKEITETEFMQMTNQNKARTLKEICLGQTKIIRSQNEQIKK